MRKIAFALMLCIVSIGGFCQSLSQAKQTENLFEYVSNGIAQRIYVNSEGQYVMSCRIHAEQNNGTFLSALGGKQQSDVERTQNDGGYVDIILGANKNEAIESIDWLENLYNTTQEPFMIEQNGKTITFDRQKMLIGLNVTDSNIKKGCGFISCHTKFINFYKQSIETGLLIRVNSMGKQIN